MDCTVLICVASLALSAIDGDTLRGPDGLRLRLWGIDAPEMTGADPFPGVRARRALFQMVAMADGIACEDKGPDRYGRTVARCDLVGGPDDGQDIACLLVAGGWARDWPKYSRGRYAACAEGR